MQYNDMYDSKHPLSMKSSGREAEVNSSLKRDKMPVGEASMQSNFSNSDVHSQSQNNVTNRPPSKRLSSLGRPESKNNLNQK